MTHDQGHIAGIILPGGHLTGPKAHALDSLSLAEGMNVMQS